MSSRAPRMTIPATALVLSCSAFGGHGSRLLLSRSGMQSSLARAAKPSIELQTPEPWIQHDAGLSQKKTDVNARLDATSVNMRKLANVLAALYPEVGWNPFNAHASRCASGPARATPMMSAPYVQPKIETGVANLLLERPEADGRGTIVAVFDTGCDVAAAGMQTTSDGKPKYVDCIDCTGGGDVDTSKKVNASDDGKTLKGLSGRSLELGEWAEDVSEFRVGAVRLYELLPKSVLARIKNERKAAFRATQNQALAETQRKIDEASNNKSVTKEAKKDLETLLTQLTQSMDDYKDAGPLLDVLLFKDAADMWRVVVSTDSANLTAKTPMAPFRYERQVGDIGFGTALSYVVQVYDDGDKVSIVVDSGSHGTHVAGIVSANFPDAPDRSGVAPGAQIFACKIGDGRLGSAETGTGLIRAIIAAKKAGCHVINLSFGEPYYEIDKGRVADVFTDAVRKWCMTVFTSAGNSGPALTTLGAPGHLSAPITVGAYVSPGMMADQYSMLDPLPAEDGKSEEVQPTSYYFTSRGPTPDGWLPTLCAPGGAIAPVPRHCLQGKMQMHGTSMASPNACGVGACVLSALRQSGLDIGPIELRRALENSATQVETPDPWAQGWGLINGPAAVAYAIEHHGKLGQDLDFRITVPELRNARGIYLRDAAQLAGTKKFSVQVMPIFEQAFQRSDEEVEDLLRIDLDIKLVSDADWVTTPATMVLSSGVGRGQVFPIRLDLDSLPPGAHFARVLGMDASDSSRGPLFSLPITVVIPHAMPSLPVKFNQLPAESEADEEEKDNTRVELPMQLPVGAPQRYFLAAPDAAEWATFRLRTGALPKGPHRLIFHVVPSARGDVPHTELEWQQLVALREHTEHTIRVPVQGGSTLEACFQLLWLSNPTPVELSMQVEYHSLAMRGASMVSSRKLHIGAADTFARIELGAPLRTEWVQPQASLTSLQRTLRPSESVISAASAELDVLPPSDAQRRVDPDAVGTQIHQMVLTYKFDVDPGDDKTLSVRPRLASLHNQLYDSPLDSMLWRLETSAGALLQYGGAMHDASAVKLSKGSYVVTALLRHPDTAQLKALEALPLLLMINLGKTLDLKVFSSRSAASSAGFSGAGTAQDGWLKRGGHLSLYIATPKPEDLPSIVSPGDALQGRFSVNSGAKHVTSMDLVYEVPPKAKKKKSDDDSSEDSADEEDGEQILQKQLLDLKVKALKELRKKDNTTTQYEQLAQELLAENRTHLPLLLELIEEKRVAVAPGAKEKAKPDDDDADAADWRAAQVGDAVDALFAPEGPIDTKKLAEYWGVAHEDSAELSKEEKKIAKEMKEQRKAVRNALYFKAFYLAPHRRCFNETEIPENVSAAMDSPFVEAVKEMKKFVTKQDQLDKADQDGLALMLADYELARGRPGAALKTLRDRMKEQPMPTTESAKKVLTRCIAMYRMLGWEHWASNMGEGLAHSFPVAKAPL